MKEDQACLEALENAKFNLVRNSKLLFYSTIVLSLDHTFDESVVTAETNGMRITYAPSFFMSLAPEEQIGLLAHEAMHVAYLHCDKERVNYRDRLTWNMAADHVINLQLLDAGISLPKERLADTKYRGKSVEEVYDLLEKNPGKSDLPMKDLNFSGSGNNGDDSEDGGSGRNPIDFNDEIRQKVQDMLVKAVTAAKQSTTAGHIPGDIEIMLDALLNPKLPWQTILRKWMNTFRKDDYSMRKPNKKYLPKYYIPTLWSEGMGDAAIFCDTSGSVSDQDFSNCIGEAHYLMQALKPKRVFFGQFDTQIKSVDVVKTKEALLNLKFTGRGGTDVAPVLKWANEKRPQFIIIFTDGYFDVPNVKMNTEVLWLIYDNPSFTAPYGKVIHYESKK